MTKRREVFASVKSSVVAIALGYPEKALELGFTTTPAAGLFEIVGTGFLVDDDGLIATAAHVVDVLSERVKVARAANKTPPDILIVVNDRGFLDQRDGQWTMRFSTFYIDWMRTYRPADIGIVYVRNVIAAGTLRPIQIADEPCEEGDEVAACGYPHGLRLHNSGVPAATFASGIISGVLPTRDTPALLRRKLQFDAMVLGGASGGPLFDSSSGRVVGVVVSNYQGVEQAQFGQSHHPIVVPHTISFAEDAFALRRILLHLKARSSKQPLPESVTGVIAE